MREGVGVVGKCILAVPTLPRRAAGAHGRRADRLACRWRCWGALAPGVDGRLQPSQPRRAPPRPVGADGSSRGPQPGGRRVEPRGPATQPRDARALPEPRGVPAVRQAGSGSEWERPPPAAPSPERRDKMLPGLGRLLQGRDLGSPAGGGRPGEGSRVPPPHGREGGAVVGVGRSLGRGESLAGGPAPAPGVAGCRSAPGSEPAGRRG